MSSFIHESAAVVDTRMADGIKVYREASVENTVLSDFSKIDDFSIVKNSRLDENASVGRRCMVMDSVLGRSTYLNDNVHVMSSVIGKYCSISWNVSIGGANHTIERLSTCPLNKIVNTPYVREEIFPSLREEPLTIGNDVWIGANACVIRGVHIGNGAVVAAGAVVTKSVPPYAIVAGVPARTIRYRFPDEIIRQLQNIKWWDWPLDKLEQAKQLFRIDLDETVMEDLKRIADEV